LALTTNSLLNALSPADVALLVPLTTVPLVQGMVLQEQEAPVEQVYLAA
jgi:hypothetical protein